MISHVCQEDLSCRFQHGQYQDFMRSNVEQVKLVAVTLLRVKRQIY